MVIFTIPQRYPHSLFPQFSVIFSPWKDNTMNSSGNTKDQLIKKQELYIRQLEEQLAVYEEKDKTQELLIEKLNQTLDLFAYDAIWAGAEKEYREAIHWQHPHFPRIW